MPAIGLTTLPLTTEITRPSGGAEQWHNGSQAVYAKTPLDVYYRFVWTRLEGATQGSYTWTYFDSLVNSAISKKQKFSFGIMSCYPDGGTGDGLVAFPEGGTGAYPLYLHNLMKAESVKDWRSGNSWTPNYNSQHYLTRLFELHKAVNQHIIDKGWSKVINCIDVRGFGAWGEWNSSYLPTNNVAEYPAGTFPTVATFKKIIDCHTQGFPDFPLVVMIAAFDGNYLQNTMIPPEAGEYALAAKNNWGLLGWRRDQWGARDNYLKGYLENNTRLQGCPALIMDRWKYAPITGEPMPSGDAMGDLVRQVNLYHATSFGDGNYGSVADQVLLTRNVKDASSDCGAKFVIESGTYTNNNTSINVVLSWRNGGNGNIYDDWNTYFLLKSASGAVVAEAMSTFKPKLFQPSGSATAIANTVNFNVPAGTYTLAVVVRDAQGYSDPMPLFNSGRQADGSYNLGSVIISTAPPTNQLPIVDAGADQTITLPTSQVTLTGSASDGDGTIVTSGWKKLSGSGTVSGTGNVATVTGLTEGTSVFEFSATDDAGGISKDTASVIVKAAPVPPPVGKKVVDVTPIYRVKYDDNTTEDFL